MKRLFVICTSIFLFMSFSSFVYAAETDDSQVKIDLEDSVVVDGIEQPFIQPMKILPGTTINKISRINNLAKSCYVRAKLQSESSEYIKFSLSDDWIQKPDGFWYYTKMLEEKGSVVIFDMISFTTDIHDYIDSDKIIVNIHVDAIQAWDFTPDFASEEPWMNIEKIEDDGEIGIYTPNTGDDSHIFLVLPVLLLSGSFILILNKKKGELQ